MKTTILNLILSVHNHFIKYTDSSGFFQIFQEVSNVQNGFPTCLFQSWSCQNETIISKNYIPGQHLTNFWKGYRCHQLY